MMQIALFKRNYGTGGIAKRKTMAELWLRVKQEMHERGFCFVQW
jgi:hypothetical protein